MSCSDPYKWGGEAAGVGSNCSGLVHAAYKAAGMGLPRVTQDQYGTGAPVAPGAALHPGATAFFGAGPMPSTTSPLSPPRRDVRRPLYRCRCRRRHLPPIVGAAFGDMTHIGATRPGAA